MAFNYALHFRVTEIFNENKHFKNNYVAVMHIFELYILNKIYRVITVKCLARNYNNFLLSKHKRCGITILQFTRTTEMLL